MGSNFHTPWIAGTTKFRVADMDTPLSDLDRAITLTKNNSITCDGVITYNPSTGALTWSGIIHLYYNNASGIATHNQIAASNITLSDNEFAYVALSATNDAAITMSKATITTGSASAFLAYNIVLLAYRNTTDDNLYGPLWQVIMRDAYILKSLFDANTILAANTDNTPVALTVAEQQIVGRITGGNIAALTPAQINTILSLKAQGGVIVESNALALDLGASSITGTLAVGDGGTGQTTAIRLMPAGGTTGQSLTKNSSTDYDVGWTTVTGDSGGSSAEVDALILGVF
jgi:hypothetical protein